MISQALLALGGSHLSWTYALRPTHTLNESVFGHSPMIQGPGPDLGWPGGERGAGKGHRVWGDRVEGRREEVGGERRDGEGERGGEKRPYCFQNRVLLSSIFLSRRAVWLHFYTKTC